MNLIEISKAIKAKRKSMKLTQPLLADLSGVALTAVKAIENGKGNPTLQTLLKLTSVLGLEVKISVPELPGE